MTPEPPAPAETPDRPGHWPKAVPLLVLAGLLAYCNSFTKAFVFDDVSWITANPDIGSFRRYMSDFGRPVVRLSLYLNYALGGLNPTGYHAFNVGVHILAALTLFGIVRRAVRGPRFGGRYDAHADHLAFAVALLWLVHPLQTQSVTYVIQRCESMMGLFYLFALYAWQRAAGGDGRGWYAAAVGSFALSAGCKEVAATLPPVLVAFDRVFLASNWRQVRGRWPAYLAVLAVWAVVLFPYARTALGGGTEVGIGFGLKVTPYQYLLTQSEVILHYLRLSVWPRGQAIDYVDWPVARSLREVWPAFLAVSALLAASLVLLVVRPAAGFVAFWFFALLAPTSSVVPIVDPAFEHRMYLSLASVAVFAVFGAHAVLAARDWSDARRAAFAAVVLVSAAVPLAALSFARNESYRSQLVCLGHAAAARPNNPRPLTSLAAVHINAGDLDAAEVPLRRAEELAPRSSNVLRQRAPLSAMRGRLAEAEPELARLAESPSPAHMTSALSRNLVWVRIAQGRADVAAETARELVGRFPQVGSHHLALAAAELAAGRPGAARAAAAEAARLDPTLPRETALEARAVVFDPGQTDTSFVRASRLWSVAAACLADGDRDPLLLDTLAMCYAWNGRFADAAAAARRGVSAAEAKGDADWARALKARLELYEAGRPYRGGGAP